MFSHFLSECDGMMAFVSKQYFSRLWCVYEMAFFCKMHDPKMFDSQGADITDDHLKILERKLQLYSLEWDSGFFSPLRALFRRGRHAEEEAIFDNFSCVRCQCTMPKDRAFVFAEIRNAWGPRDTHGNLIPGQDGIAEFDRFVQRGLKKVFFKSKRRYETMMFTTLREAFFLAFG